MNNKTIENVIQLSQILGLSIPPLEEEGIYFNTPQQ